MYGLFDKAEEKCEKNIATSALEEEAAVRILVTDFDNCAFDFGTPELSAEHFLSALLVAFARENNYEGFYGCTHRCYWLLETGIINKLEFLELTRNLILEAGWTATSILPAFNPDDIFTIHMVNNLIAALNKGQKPGKFISCFAVSTPDDKGYYCGHGYDKILGLFEQKVMDGQSKIYQSRTVSGQDESGNPMSYDVQGHWTDYPFKSKEDPLWDALSVKEITGKSKNEQLLQIIEDALVRFPRRKIIIDFVDDVEEILANAANLEVEMHAEGRAWPAKLEFNIYHHNAFKRTPVQFRKRIEARPLAHPEKLKEQEASDCSPSFSLYEKMLASIGGCQAFLGQCCTKVSAMSACAFFRSVSKGGQMNAQAASEHQPLLGPKTFT